MRIFEAVRGFSDRTNAAAIISPRGRFTYSDLILEATSLRDLLRAEHDAGEPVVAQTQDPFATAVVVLGCDAAGVPVIHRDPAAVDPGEPTLLTDVPADRRDAQLVAPFGLFIVRRRTSLRLPAHSHTFMTSGTTGSPVGVVRDAGAIIADAQRVAGCLEYGPDSPTLVAAPLFHAYGFNYGLIAPLLAGTSVRHVPSRSLSSALSRAAESARILIGLPFHYEILATQWMPSLRKAVTAGAPLSREVVSTIQGCGSFVLYNCYGSSEVGAATLMPIAGDEDPGDVGVPLPGIAVCVDRGELLVRSSSLAAGRLTADGMTPLPLSCGWYRTGDLAEVTVDNHILLGGRLDAIINVAGKKIHPSEIESVLSLHPAVADVHVFAESDESRGRVPVAQVILRGPATTADLEQWCRGRLAPYQQPRRILAVDEIPRSATGKVTAFLHKEEK
ncbi:class I adenylate-forming enzyme family protein [Mycolicibacterium neoaurum]|uniref:class I adenylate-forming enzyme family protein n=1 Tax=Mycolicibacterium neoaurum TaxID=1795 RepID=UPI001F4D1837|nr:fatty acid--CoA ligase family protein [Mycolicibacterium neoaurum]